MAAALSQRETALLAALERERRTHISISELEERVGKAAAQVASRMAAKGVLYRIGRGLYAVRPLRALPQKASSAAPVLVAHLLQDSTYYLGGLWALTQHRLTSQQYVSVLDAFVVRARRSRPLGHARVVFHLLRPPAFDYGIGTTTIESAAVRLSDAERTLLDLLDYPDVAGGVLPAVGMFQEGLSRVDRKKLVGYAVRGSRTSTCQRLGVFLDRAGTPPRILAPLRKRVGTPRSRLSMIPDRPRTGRLNARWNVVENDPGAP